MGKVYENPPIIEAVCEFRFKPGQEWDWTIPGLIYDRVKDEFPKKRQLGALQFQFHVDAQQNAEAVQGGIARMQFLREDEKAFIQVGPDMLVVNQLRPYPTWGVFKQMIIGALEVYRAIAQPKGFQRIGLRYINRIGIPEPRVEIEDYLLAVPRVPEPVPQLFATWLQRVEIPFDESNGVMVLQSGNLLEPQQGGAAFILDLDFFTMRPDAVEMDAALKWVEEAHNKVEATFEACITDKSRDLFGGAKESVPNG